MYIVAVYGGIYYKHVHRGCILQACTSLAAYYKHVHHGCNKQFLCIQVVYTKECSHVGCGIHVYLLDKCIVFVSAPTMVIVNTIQG